MTINPTKLQELKDITHHNALQLDVSFWGERMVSLNTPTTNYHGTLVELAGLIIKTAWEKERTPPTLTSERVHGIDAGRKVHELYQKSDSIVASKNWFTRLLVYLREWVAQSPSPRALLKSDVTKQILTRYRRDEFMNVFGHLLTDHGSYKTHPHAERKIYDGDTVIHASESAVRSAL